VFDATYLELSRGDRDFLQAMLPDGGSTAQADLPARLGKSSSHVSNYKRRLLEQGVIEGPRRGVLTFALPGFRAYLEEELPPLPAARELLAREAAATISA
jgi:DNA-binding Lrp family transcriptional regulator